MARPQKQTVDYFPHEANASDGDTLTILQSRFGNDGYSFWFKLLEKLSSSENHVIDCRNPVRWQLLLAKTSVNEERGSAIMDLLCELEAIDAQLWRESKIIWCQKLVNNVADVYKNRNRPVPERPVSPNNLVSSEKTPVSTPNNPQTKVKETKVKESPSSIKKKEGVKPPATYGAVTKASEYLFEKTGRKRWSNLVQKELFESTEAEVDFPIMKAAIDWALVKGISDIQSIITAAKKKFKEKEKISAEKKEKGTGYGAGQQPPGRGTPAHQQGAGEGDKFSGFHAIESGPDEPDGGDED